MTTTVAFRTAAGGVSVPAGSSRHCGEIDVSAYERIRVVAEERITSMTGVCIRLALRVEPDWVSRLDVFRLRPGSSTTRVYDVPGTTLDVYVDSVGATGADGIRIVIYGCSNPRTPPE